MSENIKYDWNRIVSLVVSVLFGFWVGLIVGERWSFNPTLITYHEQELIVRPGDVACPEGHTCTWKAYDLNTNQEVKP